MFCRAALESYLPRIQKVVSWELRGWCMQPGSIAVYSSAKTLTFRIAAQILLGLRLEEKQFKDLAKTFEQLVENLFSLPLNVPFSGLRKVLPPAPLLPGAGLGWAVAAQTPSSSPTRGTPMSPGHCSPHCWVPPASACIDPGTAWSCHVCCWSLFLSFVYPVPAAVPLHSPWVQAHLWQRSVCGQRAVGTEGPPCVPWAG